MQPSKGCKIAASIVFIIKQEANRNTIIFVKYDPNFSTSALSVGVIWTIGFFYKTKPYGMNAP
jgi:hypothetical protein